MQWLIQLQSSKNTEFKVRILPHEAIKLAIVQKSTHFTVMGIEHWKQM